VVDDNEDAAETLAAVDPEDLRRTPAAVMEAP
jgi:hypothetical protein